MGDDHGGPGVALERFPVRGGRRRGTPTVVFLDDSHWNAFVQLSALLRRHGVRTVRVTTEVRTASRIISTLLFDRHAVVRRDSVHDALHGVLSTEDVIDVQFVEPFRDSVLEVLGGMEPRVAARIERRLALMDKMWASEQFARSRLHVPAKTPMEEASPESAAERYGFPLVVKARVGCSGNRVRIVHDLPGLRAVAGTGWARAEAAFYEQYVHGEKLNYAAAVGPAAVEQEVTYRVAEWRQPVGSAEVVETVDDQGLTELGRRAVEAAGCTGLVNIDVIRDDAGQDWLIDFNPRAFGGSVSFLKAGLDMSEGYLFAIGARDQPPSRRSPAAGTRIHVFPTCIEGLVASGKVVRTASAYVREARPYLEWLGLRYWVVEAGVTTYAVMAASLGLPSRRAAVAEDAPSPESR